MIDRARYLRFIEDRAIIVEFCQVMYRQYQEMRAEIFQNQKYVRYKYINVDLGVDYITINSTYEAFLVVKFPTQWLSDTKWMETARKQLQNDYDQSIIDKLST